MGGRLNDINESNDLNKSNDINPFQKITSNTNNYPGTNSTIAFSVKKYIFLTAIY